MSTEQKLRPVTPVPADPWLRLRQLTDARVALGRAGASLPTVPLLEFQLAHARARDAVHLPFDAGGVERQLRAQGRAVQQVHSRAESRSVYLQRPDLGRRLDATSRALLAENSVTEGCDAVLVVADGLSPLAVHSHAAALVALTWQALRETGWRLAPVVIAGQARVALGDEVGELLHASQVAVLIGERPGLSAADSLGIYLTYAPRVGRTDAERNCISNIRPEGLGYQEAAGVLVRLMSRARQLGLTGVGLKDDGDVLPSE